MQTKGIPQIEDDECINCHLPVGEICTRCGCDCDNRGGLKAQAAYCEKGCDCGGWDNAPVFADDEADAAWAEASRLEPAA